MEITSANNDRTPTRIFLPSSDATLCKGRVYDEDVEYVRADIAAALVTACEEALKTLEIEHGEDYSACTPWSPEHHDVRCEGCFLREALAKPKGR